MAAERTRPNELWVSKLSEQGMARDKVEGGDCLLLGPEPKTGACRTAVATHGNQGRRTRDLRGDAND